MKILHTSDWHIGKIVNEYDLLSDQQYILNKLFTLIEIEKVDVVVISGDIYDRSIPPKEAVELLDFVLTKLIDELKIPTLIISGNHDSSERLNFASKMLEAKKLFIQTTINENVKKVVLDDEYGKVNFYLLPYAHPTLIRHLFNEDKIIDHNEAMKKIMEMINDEINYAERNILVNHNFIRSFTEELDVSDSERCLSIGGADYVDVELVNKFDYVALGHLHKPQKVKYNHVRYSGSLLKYSMQEVKNNKGVYLIDLKEKGNLSIRFVELSPLRDMKVIQGNLEQLTSKAFYQNLNVDDYYFIELLDKDDVYDPLSKLRAVYPNLMQIIKKNLIINVQSNTKASGEFKQKSKMDLFNEFYFNITNENLTDEKNKIIVDVINEVEKEQGDNK